MVAGVADAFVTVSLAGSLFFSISPQASRNQVLLYLIVRDGPLRGAGPAHRAGGGPLQRLQPAARRRLLPASGQVCFVLAITLYDLTFYLMALALLVSSKASGVVRQALVPKLVGDHALLVSANSSIARLGTIAAGVGGAIGALILAVSTPRWLLSFAAVVFLVAALIGAAVRVPLTTHEVSDEVEYAQLHMPGVVYAAGGLLALRGAVGYFVFLLAFSLRTSSEPPWVYGIAVFLYGLGSFLGNVIAPRLRRRFHEERLLAGSLLSPAIATAIGLLGVARPLMMIISLIIGVSASVARQGFDSLVQRTAPEAATGRAFARYEWRFQLAWVSGAALATAITLPIEAAMGLLAAVLAPAAVLYIRAAKFAERSEPSEDADPLSAARTRYTTALTWSHGDARHAVIDASSAVDIARGSGDAIIDDDGFVRLEELRRQAVDPVSTVGAEQVEEALRIASGALGVLPDGSAPVPGLGEGTSSGL